MRRELYLFVAVVILSTVYGIYSVNEMHLENRTPYTISCDGILLDKTKTYAISNLDRNSIDTLSLHFEQAKVLFPSTLGYIYFDRDRDEFVLRNGDSILNQAQRRPDNCFLPFCRTLEDGAFEHGIYFGANDFISEEVLLERGIKFNSAAGTKENRISLEFRRTKKGVILLFRDEGIKTKYLVQRNAVNTYEVYLNRPVGNSTCANIFQFEHTTNNEGVYTISVSTDLFKAAFEVVDDSRRTITKGKGKSPAFFVNEYHFSIEPKYSRNFTTAFTSILILLLCFQIYLLIKLNKTKSPLIQALYSFRILLNCICFLAIPLFLTSYYFVEGRLWYLLLLVALNISVFAPKDLMLHTRRKLSSNLVAYSSLAVLVVAPFVFKFATISENLFGIVPILHCQKALLLLLISATQLPIFSISNGRYFIRIAIIIGYSLIITILTSDTGSFLYTGLAIILVELIRKSITLKRIFVSFIAFAVAVFLIFQISPSSFSKSRKAYRIVAPYVSPDSDKLELANQSDRESYSSLNLNLKNLEELVAPGFNDLIVPGNMRSTMHSDFAFHWSVTFGGFLFFFLFISIMFIIVSKLLILLYCSIRVCRVHEDKGFIFPQSRRAELVRYLLAFTIIGLTYPIASNLLLVPLTGQSIPVLSISNIELIFLMILIVSLENIFNNPKHYVTISKKYSFGDVRKSIRWGLTIVGLVFMASLLLKYVQLNCASDTLLWKKHISEDRLEVEGQIPDGNNKQGLVDFAHQVIGTDILTSVSMSKKPILKNLASLYFTTKPYNETIYDASTFYNSTEKMRDQMSVDSFFSENKKLISGEFEPYGKVYSMRQRINNRLFSNVSHRLYSCIPLEATSINADLTAECNDILERHLASIGYHGNIGSVVIVDNRNGGVLVNSTSPLNSEFNSNEAYYFVGSLKKTLLAYCALAIDGNYRQKRFGGITFEEFIQNSDDFYAASLLKDLLINHRFEFDRTLRADFNMPLYSITEDAFLDFMPSERDFTKFLDRNNTIYRQAIGQQRPYKFIEVMNWYSRIASNSKLRLNYYRNQKDYEYLSISSSEYENLTNALNSVLKGTALTVGKAMKHNGIEIKDFICKTGTAEKADRSGNASSSFIIANGSYTIGVMLKGRIPENDERLAAKDLFIKIIPLLIKYNILNK